MNIRNIKSNLNIIPDNIIKIIYDLLIKNIDSITDYIPNVVYNKGDKVYKQENGKHQVYQCVAEQSSQTFIKNEWQYVMEVYNGTIDRTVGAINIAEELHIIDENTVNSINTDLPLNGDSIVAIYHGKKRYITDIDFTINGNIINFNNPFNIGDRVILEVKRKFGNNVTGIVIYDINGMPYLVCINETGSVSVIKQSEKASTDVKYTELVTGECTYTLIVDSSLNKPKLAAFRNINNFITGTDNKIYKINVNDNNVNLTDTSNIMSYSDIKIIMGSDRKFYTIHNNGTENIITEVTDPTLKPEDFDIGIKVVTDEFRVRMIDIVDGNFIIRDCIKNGGYHNIMLKDIVTGELKRIYLDTNNDLMIDNKYDYNDDHYSTYELDYFYFFSDDWKYYKLYVENGKLLYDEHDEFVYMPDSRGINMLSSSGDLIKISFVDIKTIIMDEYVKVHRNGTFESPIEGFVVDIDGEDKLVTINKYGNGFEIVNTEMKCRYKDHYIISEEGDLYQLNILQNNVSFVKVNYIVDNYEEYRKGAFIKSHEMITKVIIKDGNIIFNPISTFMHRVKSTDNNHGYLLNTVDGVLKFYDVDEDMGMGYLYIKDNEDNLYKGYFDEVDKLTFDISEPDEEINYELTSLICSEEGWYKMVIVDQQLTFKKIFDNIYEKLPSYGNIVKRHFVMKSVKDVEYSIFANGNGEIRVKPNKYVEVEGIVIKSDNGFVYGLGIDGKLASYNTFIHSANVMNKLPILDSENGLVYSLSFKDDQLCFEVSDIVTDITEYTIYDICHNPSKLKMTNGRLTIINE